MRRGSRVLGLIEGLVVDLSEVKSTVIKLRHLPGELKRLGDIMKDSVAQLNSAISDLEVVEQDLLAQVQQDAQQIATIAKSSAASDDDTADLTAATARIQSSVAQIKSTLAAVRSAAQANTSSAAGDSSSSSAAGALQPVVDHALAGVPATPLPTSIASTGAAVPNTDLLPTDTSVNIETSGQAAKAPGADVAQLNGEPVQPTMTDEVLPADQITNQPSAAVSGDTTQAAETSAAARSTAADGQ